MSHQRPILLVPIFSRISSKRKPSSSHNNHSHQRSICLRSRRPFLTPVKQISSTTLDSDPRRRVQNPRDTRIRSKSRFPPLQRSNNRRNQINNHHKNSYHLQIKSLSKSPAILNRGLNRFNWLLQSKLSVPANLNAMCRVTREGNNNHNNHNHNLNLVKPHRLRCRNIKRPSSRRAASLRLGYVRRLIVR